MKLFNFGKKEQRASIENPNVQVTPMSFWEHFVGGVPSASGINVTLDVALGVPAVWAAINFISGTIAGLPLHIYKKSKNGREKVNSRLAILLHDAFTDEITSFEGRKLVFDNMLSGGRGLLYIEKSAAGEVINLIPLDPSKVVIKRINGAKTYEYTENGKKSSYPAQEIIDLPFMLKPDGVSHRSPIASCKDAIGLAVAATNYGSQFLANGGVPPFAITGQFQTAAALTRASDEFQTAVKKAASEKKQALVLPFGLDVKSIGGDPDKAQLVELQRFCIEQVARIYSIPPTFLQDLTHGTMSNTEQQDLHFTKHTIKRYLEQFEQELNLKLFGRYNNKLFVEFNLDGLLRGDFPTRMAGYAQAIQSAVYTPAEARAKENLPLAENSDVLLIQGATVPLGSQPINNSQVTG